MVQRIHRRTIHRITFIAGAAALLLVLAAVNSLSLNQESPLHGAAADPSFVWSKVSMPDLAVQKVAPSTVAWDGAYNVEYTVTNRGGRAAQAHLVETRVSAMYDDTSKKYLPAPLVFSEVVLPEGMPAGRVRCGPVGTFIRCIFAQGIDAGETVRFVVKHTVPPREVQCDKTVTLDSSTVFSGQFVAPAMLPSQLPRIDAYPIDNVSGKTSVRIDCSSIVGDMQVSIQGPTTVTPGSRVEYDVTLSNVGSIQSAAIPVAITFPPQTFDIVSVEGRDNHFPCMKPRRFEPQNQRTCIDVTSVLKPGESTTFRAVVQARETACVAGAILVQGIPTYRWPTPANAEIYDTNSANNSAVLSVTCEGASVSSSSVSSSSSVQVTSTSSSSSSVQSATTSSSQGSLVSSQGMSSSTPAPSTSSVGSVSSVPTWTIMPFFLFKPK